MGKKLFEINAVPYGSTGHIVNGIITIAQKNGYETCVYNKWTREAKASNKVGLVVGSHLGRLIHRVMSKLTGFNGCFSVIDTYRLIKKIKSFNPDIIHLHIMHNWYINLPMLFNYLKKHPEIKVVWTLHDCWALTGQCAHFTMAKCDKWKTGCHHCPQIHDYPAAYIDQTKLMWKLKKKWFTGIDNMIIVTPSQWLADLVKESFLAEYSVKVINNGIDLSVFKPTASDFREKHGIGNKHIVLGVAFGWGKRKGLDAFVELAKRLDPEKYQIVLVGTDDEVDKQLPNNIISIHRTQNQLELAALYSMADIFVNPTREEVLGMVNVEALACGLPVVTYKTGGSPESIDEMSGSIIEYENIDMLEQEIIRVCKDVPYSKESCIKRAQNFERDAKFTEYVELFN